jgi:LysR family hydrogen peroxide-inducible transcriptional activator
MNIQQFQYVLAVAETKHFEQAADKCFISQSTLSTMISKFEGEIGIKIFDRKKKPLIITQEGEAVLEQLRIIKKEIDQLDELTKEIKGEFLGSLSISVIPTIAPFLLPLFLQDFAKRFPKVSIQVKEQTTSEIMRQIKSRELDIGILSTPLLDKDLVEIDLYDEPFIFYDSENKRNQKILPKNLDMSKLCLLEEGHCMRTQVENLCDIHKMKLKSTLNFDYKAGSIDSLLRFVRANEASTLLPFLSTLELSDNEKTKLSQFADPIPYRSVGIVVHRHFVKNKILDHLKSSILTEVRTKLPKFQASGEQLAPL